MSLPMRGAWIEITFTPTKGEAIYSRSPCGERGLKSHFCWDDVVKNMSLPMRGAWIEILFDFFRYCMI